MAYLTVSYDLPEKSRMFEYSEEVLVILAQFRRLDGFVGVQGMRSLDNTSPNVIAILEFAGVSQVQALLTSELVATQLARLREIGCTGIRLKAFDQSPLIPRA